jgi:hypothetical protein
MLSVSPDSQYLLSPSVFSYVYFASVADTFLFYWINVCFGDFMQYNVSLKKKGKKKEKGTQHTMGWTPLWA